MLHARHYLLADIAAFIEIDAAQPVHVGIVRRRSAIHEVDAAARNAAGDAMRLVGAAVDQVRADKLCDFWREVFRNENAPAETFLARVGEGEIRLDGGLAVPCG